MRITPTGTDGHDEQEVDAPVGSARTWKRFGLLVPALWSGIVGACAFSVMSACGDAERLSFDHEDAGGFGVADAPSSEACETFVCSRDLHSVLSGCTGAVLRECPPDMGCANGACVSACSSAEKNEGTIGCSFWTTPFVATVVGPPSTSPLQDHRNSCLAAFVANTWNSPVNIQVEFKGEKLDLSRSVAIPHTRGKEVDYELLQGPLPPGEIAIVFLNQSIDPTTNPNHIRCPFPAAVESNEPTIPLYSGEGAAFNVTTDRPVSAYSIYPYGGAKSYIPAATVLLPTSAWDTNYLVVDAWDAIDRGMSGMNPSLQIIAANDDTEVRIRPNDDLIALPGGTASADGRTKVYNLARGEILQITQPRALVGSPIESDKPIGMFGGSTCTIYPSRQMTSYCDVSHQQIPPLRAWGSEYAAVRYETRRSLRFGKDSSATPIEETVPWRLVGAADRTTLTYRPERPQGAPRTLSQGETVTFWTDKPFVVSSQDGQHPFYLASYMTSLWYYDGANYVDSQIGDPDFVNVIPVQQYLDSYTFFTDVTFNYTSLVVVRHDRGSGFKDVVLDCAGPITDWKPVDAEGRYQYAYVTMVLNGEPQPFGDQVCANGRHAIRSEEPFALTVWGMDVAASYGYPGGAGLRAISSVEIPVVR
jgi:IgGFc binding protein